MSRLCIVIETPDERSDTLLLKTAEVAAVLAAGELRSAYVEAPLNLGWFGRLFGIAMTRRIELFPPNTTNAGDQLAGDSA